MTSGPAQKFSHLARDLGALLLVGASFLPRNSQAAETVPEDIKSRPVPERNLDSEQHHIKLANFNLPSMRSSAHVKRAIPSSLTDRSDVVGAIANSVATFDDAFSALKVGHSFNLLGESGRLALTGQGGVRFSLQAKNASGLPRMDLFGEPFNDGGSFGIKIKLF